MCYVNIYIFNKKKCITCKNLILIFFYKYLLCKYNITYSIYICIFFYILDTKEYYIFISFIIKCSLIVPRHKPFKMCKYLYF